MYAHSSQQSSYYSRSVPRLVTATKDLLSYGHIDLGVKLDAKFQEASAAALNIWASKLDITWHEDSLARFAAFHGIAPV
jgi:hypothetical protein